MFPLRSTLKETYFFLLRRPIHDTLIHFDSADERNDLSQRVLQRLGIGVEDYSVLNLHKIGINVPGRFVFDELMTWDHDSPFWPNRLARVKRVKKNLDQVDIYFLGLESLFGFKSRADSGIHIAPLFQLKKIDPRYAPRTSDMDNARTLLYTCSGGYPIGIFSLYVRSSIAELGEQETSQLFFMVAFDFYGQKGWLYTHFVQRIWEAIHNRVTTNVLNRIKMTCEDKFQSMDFEN
jgi:hypothetical protein